LENLRAREKRVQLRLWIAGNAVKSVHGARGVKNEKKGRMDVLASSNARKSLNEHGNTK